MAEVLAIENVYELAKARFASDGTSVPFLFGWRAPGQQLTTGRRIVWVPGDPAGNVGSVQPPRNNNLTDARSLAQVEELCTVYVHGEDVLLPEDELAQYRATRLLFDAWFRAIHKAAYGTFRLVSVKYVNEKKERRSGATIRVVLAVHAVIPDQPYLLEPLEENIVPADAVDGFEVDTTAEWDTSYTADPPAHSQDLIISVTPED